MFNGAKTLTSKKILFLHLSDIHIRDANDEILARSQAIAATTFQHLPEVEKVILIVSGDIAWSGTAAQYELAATFLKAIKELILAEGPHVTIDLTACPGNHDCDFSFDNETREAVLARIRGLEGKCPSNSLVGTATSIQDAFFAFNAKISQLEWQQETRLSWKCVVRIGAKRVGIRCLNVAWMSELKERQGALVYPVEAIIPFDFPGGNGLAVTVFHHPFNWFHHAGYRAFQAAARQESHIIFTGHEHFQNVGEVADLRSDPSVFVEGGVLFEKKILRAQHLMSF